MDPAGNAASLDDLVLQWEEAELRAAQGRESRGSSSQGRSSGLSKKGFPEDLVLEIDRLGSKKGFRGNLVLEFDGIGPGDRTEVRAGASRSGSQTAKRATGASATEEGQESNRLSWAHWTNLVAYVFNAGVTYTSLSSIYGKSHAALCAKYQTLITPDRWTFIIWFFIFLFELVFVGAQMSPRYRRRPIVTATTPWWLATCLFQISWALTFAEEQMLSSVVCMAGVMGSLLGMACVVEKLGPLSYLDYALLRAPFVLHLGWVFCDFAVNVNMLIDTTKAGQGVLLGSAMLTLSCIMMAVTAMSIALHRPEPIVGAVATWAFAGIATELFHPTRLLDPGRFNPQLWDETVIDAVRISACGFAIASSLLSNAALAARFFGWRMSVRETE